MNDGTGWIRVHHKLLDHPRFNDSEWLSIWIYLLLQVTSSEKKSVWNGEVIQLKPGQLITTRFAIAEKTGVHESKVVRVLHILKTENQIDIQPSNRSSLVTLLNWNEYQADNETT